MKVNDIRSFFKKPGGGSGAGSSRGASASREEDEEQVVEIPSRLKKGKSKKSKKDEDKLNVSIERSEDDADSDKEEPPPKSKRGKKEDKKRKAKVLSDSDEDDDFKPTPKKSSSSAGEKPAAKVAKVEKPVDNKKKDLKPVNPADFFGSAPVKREARKDTKKVEAEQKASSSKSASSPEKKESKKTSEKSEVASTSRESKKSPAKTEASSKDNKKSPAKAEARSKDSKKSPTKAEARSKDSKKSPTKAEASSSKDSKKSKPQNGKHEMEDSPHKPPTSLIEPKKLKMETPTPEKRERASSKSTKVETPPKKNGDVSKKTPEKKQSSSSTFKVPTPVTTEKSKSRTKAAASKPSVTTDDDDEEDDFDPRKKASTSKSSKSKSEKAKKKRDKTPSGTDDDEKEEKEKRVLTDKQKENFQKYLTKMSIKPKNLGSKIIPEGAPNCLQGLTFVISGVLDSLEREDCSELVKKYGGRVTTSVSSKTSYLIVGDDPGESKVRKAVQLKKPQISEDDLLEMLRKSNPKGNSQDSGLEYSEEMNVDSEPFKTEDEYDPDKSLFNSPASSKGGRSSPRKSARSPSKLAKEESPAKRIKTEVEEKDESKKEPKVDLKSVKKEAEDAKMSKPVTTTSTTTATSTTIVPADAGLMWVDKYKPKTLKGVVGQMTDSSNARKLVRWLQNWFKLHNSADEKVKAAWPGLKDPEGKTFKAALLSGPPGIGKTTSAHLAVREVGYDYFELNASDTRNKRGLHENVADALSSKTLVFGKQGEELARKHVLIMDEVDGMSGNEDRGGVQELIALIKKSRVPIICICNDRNHQKIRSLANYCYDLRFYKPTFEQLRGFISSICFKEKMKIPMDKVQQLIISSDHDVRQILHQLELFKEGKSDQAYNPKKDLRFGPWDVIRKVFLKAEHDKMTIHDKNGLFFQDYNIGPLFVQENYLKWDPIKAGGSQQKQMQLISKTASSLGDGDLVESVIRRSQNWGLLPVQGVFQSFLPGEYMESNYVGGVEFPHWLGRNSNKNKRHRLLQSLHTHLHLQVSGSLEALNMDYLPYLRRSITKPLIAGDHLEAAKLMEDYTLLRDDLESITDLSLWPGTKDPMDKVETKVKSAFTRQVNKEILPYSNAKPVKGKGRGGGGNPEDDLEALLEEGEGEIVEEEEEEESLEKDAMVKVKKAKKPGTSKAAASTTGKGKGKKTKDDYYDDDDEEEYAKPSKASKSKATSKSRK